MDVQNNDQSCKNPAEVSVYKREPIRSKQAEQLVSNRVSCCEVQDKTKNINKEVEMSRKVQVCLGWTKKRDRKTDGIKSQRCTN